MSIMPDGWQPFYDSILEEFGYDREQDRRSARLLDDMIAGPDMYDLVCEEIRGRLVFVVGAGPSLDRSMRCIARHRARAIVIAADTAVKPLMQARLAPDVIFTDLDGDLDSQITASRMGAAVVVHAHGDNQNVLHHSVEFPVCVGTTQAEPVGRIRNFGGFTDGDRAAFFAAHCGARMIVLFGMEFGRKIGKHSETPHNERTTKLLKLKKGEELLEWLAGRSTCQIFTMSGRFRGIQKISCDSIAGLAGYIR